MSNPAASFSAAIIAPRQLPPRRPRSKFDAPRARSGPETRGRRFIRAYFGEKGDGIHGVLVRSATRTI